MSVRRPPRGTWLVCQNGCLWVTEPGDRADRLLREGERMLLPPRRGIVVSAIGGGTAALTMERSLPAVFRAAAAACVDC